MTDTAPPRTTHELTTDRLERVGQEQLSDAAQLLDHRTRSRAIHARLAKPGPHLEVRSGESALLIALEGDVTHIGRGISAHIRLEDQRVSRHHAILLAREGGMLLLDDRSATGTFVNGKPVREARLEHGDAIALGPVRLRYVEVTADEAARAGNAPARERLSQRALEGWMSSKLRARARARSRGGSRSPSPAPAPAGGR